MNNTTHTLHPGNRVECHATRSFGHLNVGTPNKVTCTECGGTLTPPVEEDWGPEYDTTALHRDTGAPLPTGCGCALAAITGLSLWLALSAVYWWVTTR